jgi:hypothetical protein
MCQCLQKRESNSYWKGIQAPVQRWKNVNKDGDYNESNYAFSNAVETIYEI